MGAEIKIWDRLKTAAKDFKATVNAEIQDWKTLSARVEEVNQANKANKALPKDKRMKEQKLTRRDFFKVAALGIFVEGVAAACSGPVVDVVRKLTQTPSKDPIVVPTAETLGVQYDAVKVLDRKGFREKYSEFADQVGALEAKIRKERPELFGADTEVDQVTIAIPSKNMSGEMNTQLYPFITLKNPDASKSSVIMVLNAPDGKGVVGKSLDPKDVVVEGRETGALVLDTGADKFNIFVFPKKVAEWASMSVAERMNSVIDFFPPKTSIKIPMNGGKLASPAILDMRAGYAVPNLTETPTPTQAPTATQRIEPTAQPIENKVGTIIFERKIGLVDNDIATIEKNSGNVLLGRVSPNLDKDKKLIAAQLKVIPSRIYELGGKYYCDCILDHSLTTYKIEIGNVLTADNSVTDKKLPGESGMVNETYSNKLASIVITPDKVSWPKDVEFSADNMVNLALSGSLKPSELRIILAR